MDLLKNREIYSLNGTPYLLIELPMSGEYGGYLELFNYLNEQGCKVVLAHPERYLSFQKDYKKVDEVLSTGVLLQSNIESILGKYGSSAKKMIKRLLKEKKITFLATDIHHKKHDYNDFNKAKKMMLKYISESEYEMLVNINPSKLLN